MDLVHGIGTKIVKKNNFGIDCKNIKKFLISVIKICIFLNKQNLSIMDKSTKELSITTN